MQGPLTLATLLLRHSLSSFIVVDHCHRSRAVVVVHQSQALLAVVVVELSGGSGWLVQVGAGWL